MQQTKKLDIIDQYWISEESCRPVRTKTQDDSVSDPVHCYRMPNKTCLSKAPPQTALRIQFKKPDSCSKPLSTRGNNSELIGVLPAVSQDTRCSQLGYLLLHLLPVGRRLERLNFDMKCTWLFCARVGFAWELSFGEKCGNLLISTGIVKDKWRMLKQTRQQDCHKVLQIYIHLCH